MKNISKPKNMRFRSKFGARRAVARDGKEFSSKLECRRYEALLSELEQGLITDLQTQVSFELVPALKLIEPRVKRDGKLQKMERPVTYKADFVYKRNGLLVVEDTKGFTTPEYIIKRKLMLAQGIQIKEIYKA